MTTPSENEKERQAMSGCYSSADGTLHICSPQGWRLVHAGTCLDCKRRTRFIGASYEWYGPTMTCLRCGRTWSDCEWMPLDFVPQSRQRSIEAARQRFRRAAAGSPVFFPDETPTASAGAVPS